MTSFFATAKKRTSSHPQPNRVFQGITVFGGGGYFWYFGQVAVHQRRAKPMVHAARAAKNTKQIGRRPSRCDIGAVRVRWHPHFSPGASRSSFRAARPQISLLSPTVFFPGIMVFGGGGYPHSPGPRPVHQRRAKPMVHAARAAKNTKQIGCRPSRCDIGAVRVRWHPHFSPGASRSSFLSLIHISEPTRPY